MLYIIGLIVFGLALYFVGKALVKEHKEEQAKELREERIFDAQEELQTLDLEHRVLDVKEEVVDRKGDLQKRERALSDAEAALTDTPVEEVTATEEDTNVQN